MKIMIFVGAIVFLLACQPSTTPNDNNQPEEIFQTTDPSRLYFNNIRSTSYDQLESPQQGVDVYRLRRIDSSVDRPMLIPKIVNNWMEDEAYIFLETNEYEAGFAKPVEVKWAIQQDSGVVQLTRPTPQMQREMADSLFVLLTRKADFQVKDAQGQWVDLWKDNTDRTSFATTLRDYYRLIEQE